MTAKNTLKEWFSNFKKPSQNHFWAWLDSFWHKSEKIPMESIEGLDEALQDSAPNSQFQAHLTDSQAHKTLFESKVDKEDGKGLSTNDYSDEEKNKLHDTANKVAVNMTVTGDVNKIVTLTFADGTTLKAPFKDLGIDNVADIKLNSLNFNAQTGVLTGIRSDNQELTVNLDGRYALVGHNHDEEYLKINEIHDWAKQPNKPSYNYSEIGGFITPKDLKLTIIRHDVEGGLTLSKENVGIIVLTTNNTYIDVNLGSFPDLAYCSFVKAGNGNINFIGKKIIGDNAITGAKGSTASIVINGNEAIININNK